MHCLSTWVFRRAMIVLGNVLLTFFTFIFWSVTKSFSAQLQSDSSHVFKRPSWSQLRQEMDAVLKLTRLIDNLIRVRMMLCLLRNIFDLVLTLVLFHDWLSFIFTLSYLITLGAIIVASASGCRQVKSVILHILFEKCHNAAKHNFCYYYRWIV